MISKQRKELILNVINIINLFFSCDTGQYLSDHEYNRKCSIVWKQIFIPKVLKWSWATTTKNGPQTSLLYPVSKS